MKNYWQEPLEPGRKDILYQNTKKKTQLDWGALLPYNQIPYTLGGWRRNWKILILQRFSHRSENSKPMPGSPAFESGTQGWEAPRAFGFKSQWGFSSWAPQDWGKQRLHSWRVHTKFNMNWDWVKKRLLGNLGQTYLCVLESLLGRWRSSVAHWGIKHTGVRGPRKYLLAWTLLEIAILTPRPGLT